MAACRSCGAQIVWAVNDATGKPEPLDAEPREDGNVEVVGRDWERPSVLRVRHLKKGEADTLPGIEVPKRYASHFSTCPHAEQHRKGRA